ncbi:MAG: cytochrome P450 [Rhizobiaceae bacterium]
MVESNTALREIGDLPVFERRTEGQDDHDYLAGYWKQSPLVRDSIGVVHSFPFESFNTLLDDRLTRQIETEGIRLLGIDDGPIFNFFSNSLLTSNGATHVVRRTPLARTFAFPLMQSLRPMVADTAEELVGHLSLHDQVDVLKDVAGPLPARIIARVLGVPGEDVPFFTKLVYSAIRALAARSQDVLRDAEKDMARLTDYVTDLLDRRRQDPQDDFLTSYLEAVEGGELSLEEIRITIVTLILAGSDTTRASIAMIFARLLQHPRQWAKLVEGPDQWKMQAVAEGLRFDPVVGALGRISIVEFELSGVRIRPGTVLAPSMLTAMRDPAVYNNPDTFDITRDDHPRHSPAFGGGVHRCLGEALARIEMEETIGAMAKFWPKARIEGPAPTLRGLSGTRGIDRMIIQP